MDEFDKDEIQNLIDFGDNKEEPSDDSQDALEQTKIITDLPIGKDSGEDGYLYDEEADDAYNFDPEDADTSVYDASDMELDDSGIYDTDDIDLDDIDLDGIDLDGVDEEQEKKPKSKRARRIRRILICALVIVCAVKFIITDTGIIGIYKKNFAHNCELIASLFTKTKTLISEENTDEEEVTYSLDSENVPDSDTSIEDNQKQVETGRKSEQKSGDMEVSYNTDVKKSVIIPYSYATESVYAKYEDGLVCAATNYLCYINSEGEKEWELTTSVIDPMISAAGDYILIAQNGGKKLCLYNDDKLVYDTDCDEDILGVNVSSNGDCVVVTTKDLYKGAVYAYNKNGQKIYGWSSGSDSVLAAAISPSSRNIAVTLLNTDNEIISSVQIFDITKTKPIAAAKYADTILFDIRYFGDTICAFGDNSLIGVKSSGKTLYDLRFDNSPISHYAIDDDRNTLLTLDSDNVPMLGVFGGGVQKKMLAVTEMPDFIDICGSRILYNMGRDVILSKSNGKRPAKYTAGMDVRNLILINSKTFFIAYSNSVELVKF